MMQLALVPCQSLSTINEPWHFGHFLGSSVLLGCWVAIGKPRLNFRSLKGQAYYPLSERKLCKNDVKVLCTLPVFQPKVFEG
jgi:hypothetical protein